MFFRSISNIDKTTPQSQERQNPRAPIGTPQEREDEKEKERLRGGREKRWGWDEGLDLDLRRGCGWGGFSEAEGVRSWSLRRARIRSRRGAAFYAAEPTEAGPGKRPRREAQRGPRDNAKRGTCGRGRDWAQAWGSVRQRGATVSDLS